MSRKIYNKRAKRSLIYTYIFFADILYLVDMLTAKRMIGYLSHYQHPALEEIADEMLAILNDRNRIMQKKDLEEINASWNNHMMHGLNEKEGCTYVILRLQR